MTNYCISLIFTIKITMSSLLRLVIDILLLLEIMSHRKEILPRPAAENKATVQIWIHYGEYHKTILMMKPAVITDVHVESYFSCSLLQYGDTRGNLFVCEDNCCILLACFPKSLCLYHFNQFSLCN